MVVLSEVKNMFWGVTLDGGKHYTQKVENAFHISMAALEPSQSGTNNYVSVMLQHEKAEFMLCSLKHGNLMQQNLDLNFTEGEEITLFLNGKGTVHLTGYLIENDRDFGDLDDSEDDSEDEDVPQLVDGSKAAKRKRKDDIKALVKKARMMEDNEDDDEDDEDDDDEDEDLDSEDYDEDEIGDETLMDLLGGADLDSDDEDEDVSEDDFDSDFDDDEDDDEDDEEDDEEDEMEVEEAPTPKDKKKSLQKSETPKGKTATQNGSSPGKKPKADGNKATETPGKKDKKQLGETPGKKDKKQVTETPGKKDKKKSETPGKKNKQAESPKKSDGAGDGKPKDTPGKKKDKQSQGQETPKQNKPEEASPSADEGSKKKKKKKKKKSKSGEESGAGDASSMQQTPKSGTPGGQKASKRVMDGGIICEEAKEGHGPLAKKGKMVHVYYTGKLQNGKVFDSNTSGKPFKFRLGQKEVIRGWDLGLEGMKVGGKRKLTIPAKMAYGNQRMGDIPPNSTLCFDVELKNVS